MALKPCLASLVSLTLFAFPKIFKTFNTSGTRAEALAGTAITSIHTPLRGAEVVTRIWRRMEPAIHGLERDICSAGIFPAASTASFGGYLNVPRMQTNRGLYRANPMYHALLSPLKSSDGLSHGEIVDQMSQGVHMHCDCQCLVKTTAAVAVAGPCLTSRIALRLNSHRTCSLRQDHGASLIHERSADAYLSRWLENRTRLPASWLG